MLLRNRRMPQSPPPLQPSALSNVCAGRSPLPDPPAIYAHLQGTLLRSATPAPGSHAPPPSLNQTHRPSRTRCTSPALGPHVPFTNPHTQAVRDELCKLNYSRALALPTRTFRALRLPHAHPTRLFGTRSASLPLAEAPPTTSRCTRCLTRRMRTGKRRRAWSPSQSRLSSSTSFARRCGTALCSRCEHGCC
eukprot:362907-Chlamydomonas_euryale.AAC.17